MTMSNSNSREVTSAINVTPMIDVLLVLLIIFMVIVPALPRGESAQIPQPSVNVPMRGAPVVLEVLKGGGGVISFRINQQGVARQDVQARLANIFANRAERVLFVRGDDGLSFTQVADAIDMGHAAGVDHIGLLTPGTQSAH